MIKKILLFYLIFIFSFTWGLSTGYFEIFPYKIISPFAKNILDFATGKNKDKKTSIVDMIKNDTNIFPSRLIVNYALNDNEIFKKLKFDKFKKRRTERLLFKNYKKDKILNGYILFHGFFDFKKNMHGAFLIDMNGNILNYWEYDDDHFFKPENQTEADDDEKSSLQKTTNTDVHGLLIYKDGSIVFTGNDESGSGLRKITYCNKSIWSKIGKYHHQLSNDSNNNIWTQKGEIIYLLNSDTGNVLKKITLNEIKNLNRDLGIFTVHQDLPSKKILFKDKWHNNDVEPLLRDIGKFKKDDLLISYRNSNLVFIIDQNLKVKWWNMGAGRRQHDPDWSNGDFITLYDNSMRDNSIIEERNEFTRILKLNLNNSEIEVLYDGEKHSAYSVIMGNHQVLPDKRILLTLPKQGRILIVNENNEKELEILNKFSVQYNAGINNAIWLPPDFFEFDTAKKKCSESDIN